MNRGSVRFPASEPRLALGFNEAPIHESGKSSTSLRSRRNAGSFNEAPIHESGKCGGTASRPARSLGFNEAPIHESGKSLGCGRADRFGKPLQ